MCGWVEGTHLAENSMARVRESNAAVCGWGEDGDVGGGCEKKKSAAFVWRVL